ncbi:MAG: hypothetical protein Q9174_001989, partial [Haloplaca sp. 1 TL-2023]
KHTSSDEFDAIERDRSKRRRKERERAGYRRRPHRSDSFDEWSSSSSQEERRRRHHHYRSSSGGPKNRRSSPSGSNVSTKIYVIRHPEERRRPQSSSEDVHVVRRVRSSDDRPGILRHSRHRYGPFDGHRSYEDHHSDEEFEDDGFERRGRSRSRDYTRHAVDGSHSFDEDYVRVTRSSSRPRRMSFLGRLAMRVYDQLHASSKMADTATSAYAHHHPAIAPLVGGDPSSAILAMTTISWIEAVLLHRGDLAGFREVGAARGRGVLLLMGVMGRLSRGGGLGLWTFEEARVLDVGWGLMRWRMFDAGVGLTLRCCVTLLGSWGEGAAVEAARIWIE